MSFSALSIDDHIVWMLTYLQVLNQIASLVSSSDQIPQFSHFAQFRTFAIGISTNVEAHLSAIRTALPPEILQKEAPWI
jgi:hypothetical protein